MSDFEDAEEIKEQTLEIFKRETQKQLIDLNNIIVAYRTRVSILEKELQEAKNVPIPKTIVEQVIDLERQIKKLNEEIEYYKKYVPVQIIINRENFKKPTRQGGLKK